VTLFPAKNLPQTSFQQGKISIINRKRPRLKAVIKVRRATHTAVILGYSFANNPTRLQAVALGIKTFGLGSGSAGGGGGDGALGGGDGAMNASAVGVNSSGSTLAAKLLPLKPTLLFAFNPEDSNTPITGIVPLPHSHYVCISATSGQIRMCAFLCLLCAVSFYFFYSTIMPLLESGLTS
jgi:hypothetical protein